MDRERIDRRAKRRKKKHDRQHELMCVLREHGEDILLSEKFRETIHHMQHGTMSVREHCENVAKLSVAINDKLRLNCNKKDLVRGALLHDYFLYDWHWTEHEDSEKLHGFHHPTVALKNAMRDFDVTAIQKDIIKKHMWPMTIIPPLCREAWVVTLADKYCSTLETLKVQKGKLRDDDL